MGPNKATILIKKAALEFDKNINGELEEYDLNHSRFIEPTARQQTEDTV